MLYSLSQLAAEVNGDLVGEPDYTIDRVSPLDQPHPTGLSFAVSESKLTALADSEAVGVLLIPRNLKALAPARAILVDDVYLAYAKLSACFDSLYRNATTAQQDASAKVAASARLGQNVTLGANVVIGENVELGEGVVVSAGTVIGPNCSIGAHTFIHSNATFYADVTVGERGIFHSGCVIGADGFGFAPKKPGWQKIYQLAGVVLGDDVEVGANTTIDRGAVTDTQIGNGVKLDNLIQIAHNVEIGDHTAIAGCTAVAGSTKIGRNCTIAGHCGIVGHLTIADGTHVAAMTLVTKSITAPGAYASGTGMQLLSKWKKSVAHFKQLDKLSKRVKQLESKLSELSKGQ